MFSFRTDLTRQAQVRDLSGLYLNLSQRAAALYRAAPAGTVNRRPQVSRTRGSSSSKSPWASSLSRLSAGGPSPRSATSSTPWAPLPAAGRTTTNRPVGPMPPRKPPSRPPDLVGARAVKLLLTRMMTCIEDLHDWLKMAFLGIWISQRARLGTRNRCGRSSMGREAGGPADKQTSR